MLHCSMELRELEGKLKAGYMNKERAAQIMEKEVIKQQEEVHAVNIVNWDQWKCPGYWGGLNSGVLCN